MKTQSLFSGSDILTFEDVNCKLDYDECVGDNFENKWGLPFKKLKASGTMVFAFIEYKSKANRNRINAKVMKALLDRA